MKKIPLNFLVLLCLSLVPFFAQAQNVGINQSGSTPSTNAILDLNTGNANNVGLIIPNVTLGATLAGFKTPAGPMANIANATDVGMMVYNTGGTQAVGYYYWSGTIWVSVSDPAAGYILNQNTAAQAANFWVTGPTAIGAIYSATTELTVSDATNTQVSILGQNTAAAGTSTGIGVEGITAQTGGYGVYGNNTGNANNAIGVYGTSSGYGVYGRSSTLSSGMGVYGISVNPTSGTGVRGDYNGSGNGIGVWATNIGLGAGIQIAVKADNLASVPAGTDYGVYAQSGAAGTATNYGGYFIASGATTNYGIQATPNALIGVPSTTQGSLILANTVAGNLNTTIVSSNVATAAYTLTLPPAGAAATDYVLASNGAGGTLQWINPGAAGGYILNQNTAAQTANYWVTGPAAIGATFSATTELIVSQATAADVGILGQNSAITGTSSGCGVTGITSQSGGYGILGENMSTTGAGVGVQGVANSFTGAIGVQGTCQVNTGTGVKGFASGGFQNETGVEGLNISTFSTLQYGVYAEKSGNTTTGTGYAVYGTSTGTAATNYGGYFTATGGTVNYGINATPNALIGVPSTTQGSLILANTVAGNLNTTIVSSNAATASYTLTLPPAGAAATDYVLGSNGAGGTLQWINPGAAGGYILNQNTTIQTANYWISGPAYIGTVGNPANQLYVTTTNANFNGIAGLNDAASGAGTGDGVWGSTSQSGGFGVLADNDNANGVATLGNNVAVSGTGIGIGVEGFTNQSAGYGVYGNNASTANNAIGVYGTANNSTNGAGVEGATQITLGAGVRGLATGNNLAENGVIGINSSTGAGFQYGVSGEKTGNIGVGSGYGVAGSASGNAQNNYGGNFGASGANNNYGVYSSTSGAATSNYGGNFLASGATINYGANGQSFGAGTDNYGGYFSGSGATTNYGVFAQTSNAATTNYGGWFISTGATTNYGSFNDSWGSATTNYGGYFEASGATNNYALVVPPTFGNVGIGCLTPPAAYELYVVGNVGVVGNITASSTITASTGVTACSDIRYKKDITDLPNALAGVMKLRGVNYYFKTTEFPDKHFGTGIQVGFIAQELEKVYPEMVFTDEQGYKSVDYSRLTPVLVEAMKQQQHIIDSLTTSLNNLHTEVTANRDKDNQAFNAKIDAQAQQIAELKQLIYSMNKVEASAK